MKEITVDKELESVTGGTGEFADFYDGSKIIENEKIVQVNEQDENDIIKPNITTARYRF